MRVLLVDSDIDGRHGLAAYLHKERCSVDQTDTGWHAWEMVSSCRYDIAVVELRLRDISGLELLRLMRSLDSAPPTIIGMRDVMPAIQRIAMSIGAAACYVKPLPPEEICNMIYKVIQTRSKSGVQIPDLAA